MPPRHVLIPTADYPPIEGGIGSVALELARECAARGHHVTVVAPWFDGMASFDAAEPYEVVRFRGYGMGWLRILPFLWAAWPHARKADLILAINTSYGGSLGLLARSCWGAPYICFAYAYEFLKFRRVPLAPRLFRRIYESAEAAIAISRYTRDRLTEFGVSPACIKVAYPGARIPAAVPAAAMQAARARYQLGNGPLILSVGRFVPRKGQRVLIEALPAVFAEFPAASCMLVGRGPEWTAAHRRVQQLGLTDRVVLPGRIADDDLAALFAACDLFALPTGEAGRGQVEGFGLVFSEAHAYGKPVVACPSGGVAEAVLDEETGLLVPQDPQAVAAAILSLLRNPERARAMGEAGRRRVESECNWTTFAEAVLEAAANG